MLKIFVKINRETKSSNENVTVEKNFNSILNLKVQSLKKNIPSNIIISFLIAIFNWLSIHKKIYR